MPAEVHNKAIRVLEDYARREDVFTFRQFRERLGFKPRSPEDTQTWNFFRTLQQDDVVETIPGTRQRGRIYRVKAPTRLRAHAPAEEFGAPMPHAYEPLDAQVEALTRKVQELQEQLDKILKAFK